MKKVYLSKGAHRALTTYLTRLGCHVETVDHANATYYPVSTHPDIFMCRLGVWENPDIFRGNIRNLRPSYPGNIIYNAVCTGKYFIHNLKYTDPQLLSAAGKWKSSRCGSAGELITVDVPQGYTRCCCLPVDDTSFITSDNGIARALSAAGADVLTIEQGHILLPDFDYGFIGGCAGHILIPGSRRAILFNGDVASHPDGKKILSFIRQRNITTVYFHEYPLTDIGSILALW